MAKIERMQIKGIRSYSPDDGSVIEFPSPLTLIVGQNGCGKTSIIESLSYLISGVIPPGCKTGASFINDPKVAGESQVKGQVKLQFCDITGQKMVCTRSCSVTQKAKRTEFKALEGVIKKIGPDGTGTSLSSRCTDLTKEMISRLGVSKAVLDYVIFCHQENSTWPLGEGKTLKDKFDAIFAATRYIKALESIRALRKTQEVSVKEYSNELNYLSEIKNKATEVKKDLAKAETQVLVSKNEIEKITKEAKPIEDQLEELDKISNEIIEIETKIAKIEAKKTELEKNILELDQNISNRFQGSLEELRSKQSEFKSKLDDQETDLHNLMTTVKRYDIELKSLDDRKSKLTQEQGRLEQETENHKDLVKSRDNLINVMAKELNISGFHQSRYDVSEAEDFITKLKDLFVDVKDEGKRNRDHLNEELEEIERIIKKYEKSLNSHENTIEQKEKIIRNNNEKISQLSSQLRNLAASENRIHNLEKHLMEKEAELKDFKNDNNSHQLEGEIKSLTHDKKTNENDLVQLKEQENIVLRQSEAQTKIGMMEKEKAVKKDTFDNILRGRQELLETLFDTRPPVEELKDTLSHFTKKCQSDLRQQNDEFHKSNTKLTKLESEIKMIKEEQQKKERELNESKNRIHQVCQENNYNEYRELVNKRVLAFNVNLSEISAFEKIYKKYINQLREKGKDDGCPLCHRNFDSQRDIRNLIEELRMKMETVPEKRDTLQRSLDEEIKLEQSILDLAPDNKTVDVLDEEIPLLMKKINRLNEEIQREKEHLEKITTAKACVEQKEKNARSMEADVSKIDDYLFDLKELDRNIEFEKSKIKGVSEGRTMQSIRAEVQEKEVGIASLTRKIDQKRDQLMDSHKTLSELEREINELNSQKLKLKSELQERTRIEHQKAELTSTNQSYEREIREASGQLQPIKEQLSKAMEEKRDKDNLIEQHMNEVKDKLLKIRSKGDKVREMEAAIKRFIDEGRDTLLSDNLEQMRTLETRRKSKWDEKRSKEKEYNRINEEINKQTILKRELDDNVKLMEKEKEIERIERKIKTLRNQLHGYGNFQNFQRDRASLQERLEAHRKRKAETAGRLQGFEDEVKRYERDLKGALYADADLKHCQKVIDMKTTEMANQDLDKYYKALDRAIMRYHGLKLADINKIIKEYWVKTYRGGDIDTIEIIAETDDEGSGASKNRRSYNYRVIMVKGATNLDMRGRCSAGQKVLASIIIRIALAETFCLNCGILALDEPTTNLDEQNVASLAHSLREIIEHRRQQKNFQLLVITHDEDFVQALGRSDYVENYFKIFKDENQHSKIKRMAFRE